MNKWFNQSNFSWLFWRDLSQDILKILLNNFISFFWFINFERFYPQSAVVGIFWAWITALLWLNVLNWTWTNVPIILEIVFRWLSSFWFLSNSSRTRARAVWSVGDNGATNHHHHHPKLQTALARALDELEFFSFLRILTPYKYLIKHYFIF